MFECVRELNWVPFRKTRGQNKRTTGKDNIFTQTYKWIYFSTPIPNEIMSQALDQSPQKLTLFIVYDK